ncbi:MAG: hypothetical protein AUH85_05635 [Chloroflexi bacterium 13_1_40CM_4_68_4]|nr:MAG: hypothetical protein AUH85_05635 [Chloroflexi bacterium 13_1_40CM_4_68_4]
MGVARDLRRQADGGSDPELAVRVEQHHRRGLRLEAFGDRLRRPVQKGDRVMRRREGWTEVFDRTETFVHALELRRRAESRACLFMQVAEKRSERPKTVDLIRREGRGPAEERDDEGRLGQDRDEESAAERATLIGDLATDVQGDRVAALRHAPNDAPTESLGPVVRRQIRQGRRDMDPVLADGDEGGVIGRGERRQPRESIAPGDRSGPQRPSSSSLRGF